MSALLSFMRQRIAAWKSAGTVRIARSVRIGHGAVIKVDRGGMLEIGPGARVGAGARILVRSGRVSIGARAQLRERASLVALQEIAVGAGASLEEMSVVMDFAPPSGGAVDVPLRRQGVVTAPVSVGAGAVIGAKAVLEAGASVAEGGHVMAGATLSTSA